MKRLLAFLFVIAASFAEAQTGGTRAVGVGAGGGGGAITAGTSATSGCIAGGVLRSISNLVECGAGLTFVSNTLTATNIGAFTSTGRITLPNGTAVAVPLGWSATTGFYSRTGTTVNIGTSGNSLEFTQNIIIPGTSAQLQGVSALGSAADIGLVRDIAGKYRVSNGSTGIGSLGFKWDVEAVTTTKTPGAAESGEYYTNTGDTDGATLTLTNDPGVGLEFKVGITAAFTLTIVPSAGESLYANGAACATSLTSSTVGSGAVITAAVGGSGGIWIANYTGTWSCT